MKYIFIVLLLSTAYASRGQEFKKTAYVRGDDYYYWTIWFNTMSCEDGFDYQHGKRWVQSYSDSAQSYNYYFKLRSSGKVLIWNKMKCSVDTANIYIDKYSISLHKYLKIKQP